MFPVAYHALIPAENPARAGQALNVLLVTENPTDRAFTAPVALWGSLGGPWRELLREEREFPARSHPHLHFTIPLPRQSSGFLGRPGGGGAGPGRRRDRPGSPGARRAGILCMTLPPYHDKENDYGFRQRFLHGICHRPGL